MSDRLTRMFVSTALVVALCVGGSSSASAGFQWVAPSDTVPALPPPSSPSMPDAVVISPSKNQATTAPEVISPVVIMGNTPAPAPVAPVPAAPAMQAPQSIVPQAQAAASPPPAPVVSSDNSVVVGFANSVPLAVALRQLLPSGYAFSVDQDVDMGTLVSFRGGRPWRDTLRDTLAPVGLTMREQGQMVAVGFAAHDITPSPAPGAMARAPVSSPSNYLPGMEPKSLVMANVPQPAPSPMSSVTDLAPVPTAAVTESWTADRGETLRKVLENWSRRANVEFDWFSEYDYPLEASVSFSGGFESAVRNLLTGFEGAHPQPVAELHSNPSLGQMVLVVQTRGNTNSD